MVQVMCISFSARLRIEAASTDYKHMSLVLQERLNALSASGNALSLLFILGMFGLIHYLKNRCVIQGKRLNEQKNNNVSLQSLNPGASFCYSVLLSHG